MLMHAVYGLLFLCSQIPSVTENGFTAYTYEPVELSWPVRPETHLSIFGPLEPRILETAA